jgi:hypothetical protein
MDAASQQNTTRRNELRHPWASAHRSPINGSPRHPDAPESPATRLMQIHALCNALKKQFFAAYVAKG